MSSRQRRALNI